MEPIRKRIAVIVLLLAIPFIKLYPSTQTSQDKAYKEWENLFLQHFQKAEEFRQSGEFEKSLSFFEKSIEFARKIADKEKECLVLLKQGLLFWNTGQLQTSEEKYSLALRISKQYDFERQRKEAECAIKIFQYYTKGKENRLSAQYQKSIENFQKAIELAKKINSQEHLLKCYRLLGLTYWELNKLQDFFALNEKALKIAQVLKHEKEEGRCLNNIGLYYWKLHNFLKALDYYDKALSIARKLKNIEEEFNCLNNIGLIYRSIGNYDKSLDYLIKALQRGQELENYAYIPYSLNNIGEIYRNRGILKGNDDDFKNAITYCEKSLTLAKKIKDKKIEIKALNNLGAVFSNLNNHVKALQYFRSGYERAEEIQDKEAMGMLLNNIGIVLYNLGNYEESTRYYQKAIDLALSIEEGTILWEAYMENAKAFQKQNRLNEALEYYKKSIQIIKDIRSQIKLEEFTASFLGTDKRIEAYHNLIDLLVILHNLNPAKGYNLEAFNYLERAKARAFLDRLVLSQIDISKELDPELQNQERELMKDISNIYTKLYAAEHSPEERNLMHEQLEEKENELETLKRKIRIKSPAYAGLTYPRIISLAETQKKLLDKKTAFFAYSIGKENSYVFVIKKSSIKIFPLPSKNKIQQMTIDYLKRISDKDNQNFQLGYDLFSELILPGLDKGIEKIIFVPDGFLHFLPFETLVTQKNKRHWLIQDYSISYTPSISSLREIIEHKNPQRFKHRRDILAFGDPSFGDFETEKRGSDIFQDFFSSGTFNFYRLKFSSIELEKIAALFDKTKRNIFQRENASEEQLKKLNLEDYKIIHFTTHSLIDEKNPDRSSIVLKLDDDPSEDGFLQMREIFDLKIKANLVTLSSCQTGLGHFIRGEGIEGLNRAFFYAGASSVLMSLWAVNDEATYQLMERFYSNLHSSRSIMESLRNTKLEMINSGILSHPYYWAGFIVSGNADQIIFPKAKFKWWLLGLSLLITGGIFFLIKKRLYPLTRQP